MKRRQVLAALSTATATSVAGCATIEAELGMRTDRLGAVTIANSIEDPFEVSVEVLREDTLVYEASHQLSPGSEQERPQYTINEWEENSEARKWTVRAKIPESEWRDATIDASIGSEDECYSVSVVTGDWPETPLMVLLGGCESENP